jgi:recombinational DNA repair ATPase RecF
MSELDSDRNNYLFDYLKMLDGQAFITTTSNNEAIISSNRPPFIFDVAGGNIIPRKRQIIAVCASPIP